MKAVKLVSKKGESVIELLVKIDDWAVFDPITRIELPNDWNVCKEAIEYVKSNLSSIKEAGKVCTF